MIKTAIFVEGQTELIFAREYLLKSFEYSNLAIECYTLFAEGRFHPTEYAYPNENAQYFFQIINVGNDNALLTRILSREKYLWNSGFDFIVGLRDMYSKNYRELSNQGKIAEELNLQFIAAAKETLAQKALKPEKIQFCYAIMETEAWILGLPHCFEYIHPNLTSAYILDNLQINLENIDPEVHFFHPAKMIEEIYALENLNYNKSKGNIAAIMDILQKDDFENLLKSDRCNSFNLFSKAITFI